MTIQQKEIEMGAAETEGNNTQGSIDFGLKNGACQGQNLA